MQLMEGRGYFIRCGTDGPFAAWAGTRILEGVAPTPPMAPWMALRALHEAAALLPGGLALVWDATPSWLSGLTGDQRTGFFEAVTTVPGLVLHFGEKDAGHFAGSSFGGWLHGPDMPTGALGEAWRQGALGWIPESAKGWSLPGFGHVPHGETALLGSLDEVIPGFLWGEVLVPFGALASLDAGALLGSLESLQTDLERALSLRMAEGAWPSALPFHRKRCGWRIGVLGGSEFASANGSWEGAAESLRDLSRKVEARLKSGVQTGPSADPGAARLLGLQAMREGLPWRASLPLPPAPPSFSPGLGSDPRTVSPLESRAAFPSALQEVFQHPPAALLRVPSVPCEEAARALLERLPAKPALRWLPPAAGLPGPFEADHPWSPAAEFPFPADPSAGTQPGLFGTWE